MTPTRAAVELRYFQSVFDLLPDIPAIYDQWLALVMAHNVQGKQAHDTRLVAVMKVHSITHMLTFNTADFRGFTDIVIVHPREL